VSGASRHLETIASKPRPAGSAAAADARAYCKEVLEAAGFQTVEHAFDYSAFPASWSMPLAGVAVSISAILLYLGRSAPWLIAIASTYLALTIGALAWMGSAGVLGFPLMRRRGVNLEAVRGAVEPTVWLVAHLDSKWQPVSMIARVAGVVGTTAGIIALFALLLVRGGRSDSIAAAMLMFTWLASTPLMLSIVGSAYNSGALDNASGVAAVIAAAELAKRELRIGVLITDGEELALAGARAWVKSRRPAVALNCDSLDDDGQLTVMYSGPRPDALASRLVRAASAQGENTRVMRLIPGVLTDSVALASAGWETLTLSRGSFRTLQRVHTSRDTLAHLRGTSIDVAARILADTATELG